MKSAAFLFLIWMYSFSCTAQSWKTFQYRPGDLLFQDIDCGGLCDAIEKVTPGLGDKHFSHVGMVFLKGDSIYVIEAIGKEVHETPIERFLDRQLDAQGRPKVVVGRLKGKYRGLNRTAVSFALKQEGVPYDDVFAYDNGKYYCSELIYDAYKTANNGKPVFDLPPMSFKDPGTNRTFPAWEDYYRKLGKRVPEGHPGCNPGSIATSDKIEIVTSFY